MHFSQMFYLNFKNLNSKSSQQQSAYEKSIYLDTENTIFFKCLTYSKYVLLFRFVKAIY